MNITAKLIQLLPLQIGISKNGQWRKQDFIVETEAEYPKKICISIWGDKINESLLVIGNNLDISFELESREFNERWYTEVKAWKIKLHDNDTKPVDFQITLKEQNQDENEYLPF